MIGGHWTSYIWTTDGLFSCGWNPFGQLGRPISSNDPIFKKIDFPSDEIVDITCGASSLFVVSRNGLFCVGYNDQGQLGLGHKTTMEKLTRIDFFDNHKIHQVACGWSQTIVWSDKGKILFNYLFLNIFFNCFLFILN